MIGKRTHGPDWPGGILVGKKGEVDWPVQEQEVLHLLRGYSDTETFLGCDWRTLAGSDRAGVVRGSEGGSRGTQVI